jgi:DNA topoisomerase-1
VGLRATGQVVLFDGFLRVYEEGRDEPVDDDDKRLPQIMLGEPAGFDAGSLKPAFDKAGEKIAATAVASAGMMKNGAAVLSEDAAVLGTQSFTQPPPRYTEATLVKRMEELGIGRPSTYASIVTTIQDREYVRKEQNRLIPEDKGRIVTIFLLNFFKRYVEYEFTAALENELDGVAAGGVDYKELLSRFWRDFSAAIGETSDLRIAEVLDVLDDALAPQLYPPKEDGSDPRICPKCGAGQLHLKTSRTGGFVGCGNYPECTYTRPIAGEGAEGEEKLLGTDGDDEIWLKDGRYGPYVQRGEVTPENKRPKRTSLPQARHGGWPKDQTDLEKALQLLSLPRHVGDHPEGGRITANLGRFGPYLMHKFPDDEKPVYVNVKLWNEMFEVGMNHAVELLAEKRANPGRGRGAAAKPLREVGEHPEGGKMGIYEGRYGPYVKWEKINATLPKDVEADKVTLDMAIELVNAKVKKPAKKAAAKKAPAKKTAAKKTTAKKAPAKKATTKKAAEKKTEE